MRNLRELLDKRAGLLSQARALVDAAEAAKRGLSAEETTQYEALMTDVTRMTGEIQREEALIAEEQRFAGGEGHRPDPQGETGALPQFKSRGLRDGAELRDNPAWQPLLQRSTPAAERRFRSWLRGGQVSLRQEEARALQADLDASGGYLVLPMQFADRLIQAVDDAVFIRQWATVYSVPNAESLGAPSLDTDPADPTWVSELSIGSEDSSMAFGRRELKPHPLAQFIKVSRKLLRQAPDVEALVLRRLAYKLSVVMENAFLNGTGVNQPLGVFTASAQGISTGRDVSTGNTATEMRFDGLIEAKYTLKAQYWPMARWIFHRSGIKQIAKLKDGEGQYLWQPTTQQGQPDRILGLPVWASEYAPSTFTASQYVGILGDFSNYWIADALNMDMQRLDELYAATGQVGFISRVEADGMPVLEEAFVRVKLAAS